MFRFQVLPKYQMTCLMFIAFLSCEITINAQTFKFNPTLHESATLKGGNFLEFVKANTSFTDAWGGATPIYPVTPNPCSWGNTIPLTQAINSSYNPIPQYTPYSVTSPDPTLVNDDRLEAVVDFISMPTDYSIKDLRAFVKLEIDNDKPNLSPYKKFTPYVYVIPITVRGYTSLTNCSVYTQFEDTLLLSYLPDENYAFQDIVMKTYYGFYSIQVQVKDVYDVTDYYYPDGVPKYGSYYDRRDPVGGPIVCGAEKSISGIITNYTNGWRTTAALNTCPHSTNWKLTTGISLQKFTKVSQGSSVYSPTMTGIQIDEIHQIPTVNNNNLQVSWSTFDEVTPAMYELEWTFVDDYKVTINAGSLAVSEYTTTELIYNFEENATRVITNKTSYNIPLIYKRGYLVYRVRMLRPDDGNFKETKYSDWTIGHNFGTISSLGTTPNKKVYKIDAAHVDERINWNYQVSFAEDGKSKNVVSYFDGLLKSRQSVTKFSSLSNQLIVTEPVYNYEGGVGVQSLPIPIIKPSSGDLRLTYQNGFLKNSTSGSAYVASDIDNKIPVSLSSVSSTSDAYKYYSPDNLLLTSGFNPIGSEGHKIAKAIPNAEGYPMIQTTYAVDDPKKIKIQGGAGEELQIGKGHETKYSYVDPNQTELDQYLGLNSGVAKFYEKVVTRDPNDQLSFSISNNKGKPVMTGLMRKPDFASKPAAYPLVQLDKVNPSDATNLQTDLFYGLNPVWDGSSFKFNKSFYNEGGSANFIYTMNMEGYEICPGRKLNVPFGQSAYVKDEANNTHPISLGGATVSPPVFPGHAINNTVNVSPVTTSTNFAVGEATIDYSLSFKPEDVEEAIDAYLDPLITTDPLVFAPIGAPDCIDKFGDFLDDELDNLDDPCAWNPEDRYSECGQYLEQMKMQVRPGMIYGKYAKLGTNGVIVGDENSYFKIAGWKNKAGVSITSPTIILPTYPSVIKMDNINFSLSVFPCDPASSGCAFSSQYNTLMTAPYGSNSSDAEMNATNWIKNWGILLDKIMEDYDPVYFYQNWWTATIAASSAGTFPPEIVACQTKKPGDVLDFFDDNIASYFVRMHPEYCHLDKIYCESEVGISFIDQLAKINSFGIAEDQKLSTRAELIAKDPIYYWYNVNAPPGMAFEDQLFMPDIKTNNYAASTSNVVKLYLEYYAILQTYIELEKDKNYTPQNAELNTFFSYFSPTTLIAPPLSVCLGFGSWTSIEKNKYYSILKSLYLAKRRKIALDVTGNLPPCTTTPSCLPLVTTNKVLDYLDGDQDTQSDDAVQAGNLAQGPPANEDPTNAQNQVDAINIATYLGYANYIRDQLKNCLKNDATIAIEQIPSTIPAPLFPIPGTAPTVNTYLDIIRNDLYGFMLTYSGTPTEMVWKGGITPDVLRTMLLRRNIILDDLCNPFLISYDRSSNRYSGHEACDLTDIWRSLSDDGASKSFFHQLVASLSGDQVLDIMEKNKGSVPSSDGTIHQIGLNHIPSTNYNKFDNLVYNSLGLSGYSYAETANAINLNWSYKNKIGTAKNLTSLTPIHPAMTLSNYIPDEFNYIISNTKNSKEISFNIKPNDNFEYNGYYRCTNDNFISTNCSWPLCNSTYEAIPDFFNLDFVASNANLASLLPTNLYEELAVPESGKLFFANCNPQFNVSDKGLTIKVYYIDRIKRESNSSYQCGNASWTLYTFYEAYIYAFDLTITGLDLQPTTMECITAYEFKNEYQNFKQDIVSASTGYSIKGKQHPFYKEVFQNYFNFKFVKEHEADKYIDFMDGANLAAYQEIDDYYSYFEAHGTTAEINSLMTLINNYSIPGTTGTAAVNYTFHNMEYLRYEEGGQEHLYINFKSIFKDQKMRKFINALKGFLTTVGISTANFAFNKLQSELSTTLNGLKVELFVSDLGMANPSLPTFISASNVFLKQGLASHQFKKFTFQLTGSPSAISNALYDISLLANGSVSYVMLSTHHSTMTDDNLTTVKNDYLAHAYSIPTVPTPTHDDIIARVAKPSLLSSTYSSLLSFNTPNFLSYIDPLKAAVDASVNDNTHVSGTLFLAQNSTNSDGKNFLIFILNHMKRNLCGFTFSSPIHPNCGANVNANSIFYDDLIYSHLNIFKHINYNSPPANDDIDIYPKRQKNNVYWFKVKRNGNGTTHRTKYFNVYIKVPDYIVDENLRLYGIDMNSLKTITTTDGTKAFSVNFVANASACLKANTFTALGITDFDLDNKNPIALENLMICDNDYNSDLFSPCFDNLLADAESQAEVNYAEYIDSKRTEFITNMTAHIKNNLKASLKMGLEQMKYALTLYGYDRAGNLIYTVPPEGVGKLSTQTEINQTDDKRNDPNYPSIVLSSGFPMPNHFKKSSYKYNSLNQLVTQNTPDGGETKFFYDAAGKLCFSQNAEQAIKSLYSYTLYDDQNRIIETGAIRIVGSPELSGTLANIIANLRDYTYTNSLLNGSNKYIRDKVRLSQRTEVVITYYDEPYYLFQNATNNMSVQDNLRSRVSAIVNYPVRTASSTLTSGYTVALHYSYDLSCNVKTMTYDMPELNYLNQQYKRIDYDYDLYSGKVNLVSYNRGFTDQFYQRYEYDDDNRITSVQTSQDGLLWDKDAEYKYYAHGPLARIQLGDLRVQGIDFAYTLQGWLKSINGDSPMPLKDMGGDGNSSSAFLPDRLQHTLYYFDEDYEPIDATDADNIIGSKMRKLTKIPNNRSLYNGNISSSLTAPGNFDALFTEYWYDQLNRIKKAEYKLPSYSASTNDYNDVIKKLSVMNTSAGHISMQPSTLIDDMYKSEYEYDLDGNIEKLKRYGMYYPASTTNLLTGTPQTYLMDNIDYIMENPTNGNRLENYTDDVLHVNASTGTDFNNDLQHYTLPSGTAPVRFRYDAIGNLIADETNPNELTKINWNLYGKVASIDYADNKKSLFTYEPGGNRFKKTLIQPNTTYTPTPGQTHLNEFYIRDASGNILAIYKQRQDFKINRPYRDLFELIIPQTGFSNVMEATIGLNPEFINNLGSDLAETYPDLLNTMLNSKPPKFYVEHNASIRNAMVMSSPTIFNHLMTSNNQQAIYNLLPQYREEMMIPLVLETDEMVRKKYIGLLAHEDDLPLMTNIAEQFAVTNVEDQTSFIDGMYAAFEQDDYFGLLDKFFNTSQAIPNWWEGVVPRLYADSDFVNRVYDDINVESILKFTLSMIAQYTDNTILAQYYDLQPDLGQEKLVACSSENERYNTYFANATVEVFDHIKLAPNANVLLGNAMERTTSISIGQFCRTILDNVELGPIVHNFLGTNLDKDKYYLAEHHMYGSSRLGIKNYWSNHYSFMYDKSETSNPLSWSQSIAANELLSLHKPWYSHAYQSLIKANHTLPWGNMNTDNLSSIRMIGQKHFELTNHLGNTMAIVSDKIVDSTTTNAVTDLLPAQSYRRPSLVAAYDYYPFGMLMPERYFQNTNIQCAPVSQPYYSTTWVQLSLLDIQAPNVLGIFNMPSSSTAQVNQNGNSILIRTPDPGSEAHSAFAALEPVAIDKKVKLVMNIFNIATEPLLISIEQEVANNHWIPIATTNVMSETTLELEGTTISGGNLRVNFNAVDLNFNISSLEFNRQDILTGTRIETLCSSDGDFDDDYRFGFNGQEKVNEIAGTGNHNTALFWEYDTRLGRRWNLDPKPTVGISDYVTFMNNPIFNTDILGDSIKQYTATDFNETGTSYKLKEGISSGKSMVALAALVSTKSGRKALGDFAKKGDVVGGYTFKKDGKNSDINLTLVDVEMGDLKANFPYTSMGGLTSGTNSTGDKPAFTMQLMSRSQSAGTLTETAAHELILHGNDNGKMIGAFRSNGMAGYNAMRSKLAANELTDHIALRDRDLENPNYQAYMNYKNELMLAHPQYKTIINSVWEQEHTRYKTKYGNLKK